MKFLSLFSIALLNLSIVKAQTNTAGTRLITVDVNDVKGKLNRNYNFCVGAGRANEGLRADWQRQLRVAHDECGFRYIRFTDY